MQFEQFRTQIEDYTSKGLKIFTTSSFQSHSLVLLHMISRVDKTIPVYFINTGYHFPETVAFKDEIAGLFGMNVINVFSSTPKYMQKGANGRLLFTSDPDYCCHLNKVQPLDPILSEYDIWINGVRADQSAVRKAMGIEEKSSHGVTRFHPMLNWNSMMIGRYIAEHHIPRHPLEEKGYLSIGCEPCTRKWDASMTERESRWFGLNKTECGLNTELVHK